MAGKKGKEREYAVTQNWYHTETRVVRAKNKKEAEKKAEDGEFINVLGWNLTGFIGTEDVNLYKNGKIVERDERKQKNKRGKK